MALSVLLASCGGDDGEAGRSSADTSVDDPGGEPGTTGGVIAPGRSGPADELRLGLVDIDSVDPLSASPVSVSQVMLADLLYDTLTVIDDDGEVRAGLATFTANEDRTEWVFTIRPEATFADGTPVAADDVVHTLNRMRSQNGQSLVALQLEDITSVEADGDRAVRIATRSGTVELPELLSSPLVGIVDQSWLTLAAAGGDQTPNPSGQYAASMSTGLITLERRSGDGPETVSARFYDSHDRAFDAFLAGELDWAPVPTDRVGEAVDATGRGGLVPFHATVMLGMNPQIGPLDKAELRQAVAWAIDRTTLADAVFGATADPLPGLVPVGVPGAATSCVDPCGPDTDRSRALAEKAFPEGQVVPLRLITDRSDVQDTLASVLEDQLRDGGLEVSTTSLDEATYDRLLRSGQQQLFLFSTLGVVRSAASHLGPLFRTGSPDNVVGYSNEAVDALIDEARGTVDIGERLAKWRAVEAAVLADAPVVPLVQLRTLAAVAPGVDGFVVRADGSVDLSGVSLDRG